MYSEAQEVKPQDIRKAAKKKRNRKQNNESFTIKENISFFDLDANGIIQSSDSFTRHRRIEKHTTQTLEKPACILHILEDFPIQNELYQYNNAYIYTHKKFFSVYEKNEKKEKNQNIASNYEAKIINIRDTKVFEKELEKIKKSKDKDRNQSELLLTEKEKYSLITSNTDEALCVVTLQSFPKEEELHKYSNACILVGNNFSYVYEKPLTITKEKNGKTKKLEFVVQTLKLKDPQKFRDKLNEIRQNNLKEIKTKFNLNPEEHRELIASNKVILNPAQEAELIVPNLVISSAEALFDIWRNIEDVPSVWRQRIYNGILTLSLSYAAPSGYTYWPIGSQVMKNAFNSTNEVMGYILGGSSAGINSFFNMWTIKDGVHLCIGEFFFLPYQKDIIHAAARDWKFWLAFGTVSIWAFFSNGIFSFIALDEQNGKVNFWVINQLIIGYSVAFANLYAFIDSIAKFLQSIGKEISKTEIYQKIYQTIKNRSEDDDTYRKFFNAIFGADEINLSSMIKQYFEGLHQLNREEKFIETLNSPNKVFSLREVKLPDYPSIGRLDVAAWMLGGSIFGATGDDGRYGLIQKGVDASDYLLAQLGVLKGTHPGASLIIETGALAPSLGWGAVSSFWLGDLIIRGVHDLYTRKSSSNSSYSLKTWAIVGIGVVGACLSWGGNTDLTAVALTSAGIAVTSYLWKYRIAASIFAASLSNAKGTVAFIKYLMNLWAVWGWGASREDHHHAMSEEHFIEYKKLLEKGLRNNKVAFEYLLLNPQIAAYLLDVNAAAKDEYGKVLRSGDLQRIYDSCKFTPIDKLSMAAKLGIEIDEFEDYVQDVIEGEVYKFKKMEETIEESIHIIDNEEEQDSSDEDDNDNAGIGTPVQFTDSTAPSNAASMATLPSSGSDSSSAGSLANSVPNVPPAGTSNSYLSLSSSTSLGKNRFALVPQLGSIQSERTPLVIPSDITNNTGDGYQGQVPTYM